MSKCKEAFSPIVEGQVKLYLCGMTVYDYCHIGHARSWVVIDALRRFWLEQGLDVIVVQNITDIDDKIIDRAQRNNEMPEVLTQRFIDAMHEDAKALHIMPPTHEPKATDYVSEMIDLIQKLIDKSHAYQADNGDVCFDVRSFKDYGKLSGRDIEKLIAGSRVNIDHGKRDPLDFVLWKQAKEGEPSWESPWGGGRPGWHIECSAMSERLLGQPFDIHCGGMDLKFPHHENEIAQSEAAYDCCFAHYWMHIGLINVDNEKMSKSLGNFKTIREVLKEYSYETIRHFMLAGHYRSPINFSEENLKNSQLAMERLYTALRGGEVVEGSCDERECYVQKFTDALNDDFNTPLALAVLFDIARDINRYRQEGVHDKAGILAATLKQLAGVLGVLGHDAESYFKGDQETLDVTAIELLISQRNQARKDREWQVADKLREDLEALGVTIEDLGDKTQWRRRE